MSIKNSEFPQYRKHVNGKHLYKIIDEKHFEEIHQIGKVTKTYAFEAKKYPEMMRIQEMLEDSLLYLKVTQKEWELAFSNKEN